MFVAHASALRSAEMGRQVGACITTPEGDVIATGTNEVPRAGGGQYWAGDEGDARDYTRTTDSNDLHKRQLAEQLLRKLEDANALKPGVEDRDQLIFEVLETTKVGDVIEYSRAIHAEMSALVDAARRGVSVAGATLYTTTFPCHLCTGLIVGAGIGRVVYIYPYPKSLAIALHGDAISVESRRPAGNLIPFEPLVGVAPRAYTALFTKTKSERKDRKGKPAKWSPGRSRARLVEVELTRAGDVPSYIERELLITEQATWLTRNVPGGDTKDG
jgi:Deoxycytidylate deaminase